MQATFYTLLIVLPVLYTLVVVGYARIFLQAPSGLARVVRPALVLTVSLHFASMLIQGLRVGSCPMGSRGEFLSLVAFAIGFIYLLLELRIADRATGVFVLAPALILQLVASVSILVQPGPVEYRLGALSSLEMFAAIIGLSAVAVAGIYGLLYLVLYRCIKKGSFGLYFRKMPPLETLFDLNSVAVWVGFPALLITVGLGLYLESMDRSQPLSTPTLGLTIVLCVLSGGCLMATRFWSLGGKRLAYSSLVGLLLVVGVLLSGFLGRGFQS